MGQFDAIRIPERGVLSQMLKNAKQAVEEEIQFLEKNSDWIPDFENRVSESRALVVQIEKELEIMEVLDS